MSLDKGFKEQLTKTGRITGALWLSWINRSAEGWDSQYQFSLNKAKTIELKNYLLQPKINTWLAGALSGGHTRTKKTKDWESKLGCQNIYAFPINNQFILLVGANKLSEEARGFYRIITANYQSIPLNHLKPQDSQSMNLVQSPDLDYVFKGSQFFRSFYKMVGLADLAEISRLSIQLIDERYKFRFISVALLDENEEYFTTISSIGVLSGSINTKKAISLSTGYANSIVKERKIYFSDGNSPEDLYQLNQSLEQLSVVYIPLIHDNNVFGILTCMHSSPDAFQNTKMDILTNFAEGLANVLFHVKRTLQNKIRIRNLEAFRELSLDLSADLEWDEVVKRLIRRARDLTGARAAHLGLLDKSDGTIEIVVYDGPPGWKDFTGRHIPPNVGMSGYAITMKKPLIIENYNSWENRVDDLDATTLAEVPLFYQSEVIGAIIVGDDRPDKVFTNADIQLLEMVAPQVALAVHNANIYKTMQGLIKKLQMYKDISLDITANLDSQTLFYRLLKRVREFMDAMGIDIGVVNKDRTAVHLVYEDSPWKLDEPVVVKIPRGINGYIVSHKTSLIVTDYNKWDNRDSEMPFVAAAGVPLIYQDQVIGVIALTDNRPGRQFSEHELEFLEFIAPQIAICLHNSQMYEALQESLGKLEASQQALIKTEKIATIGRLTASMAHEINNPLQSVQNCIHLARRQELTLKERETYLELADREMDRLKTNVSRVLDMYRPASVDRKLSDINQIVNRVLQLVEQQCIQQHVKINLDLTKRNSKVYVVSDQIHQVILNMVLNSLQVMPNGGIIYVSTKSSDHEIKITIEDTGPGIPVQIRDKLFQPFESSKKDGTGLGLTISYGIMTAHGGQINIIEGRGKGACFEIIIPAGD